MNFLIFFAFLQAIVASVVTVNIQASGQIDSEPSSTTTSDSGERLKTTIYSTATVTDSNGAVKTTLQGSVSTYLSIGYSEQVLTLTTSVPVTSTYTSAGPSTVVVVTTYTVQTTSCVTSISTSMIVSTVSTEKFTIVSCADKKCQTTQTMTQGASQTSDNSTPSSTGLVTISTITGTESTTTESAAQLIVTTIQSRSGSSTIMITTTQNEFNSDSKSISAGISRASTLTFQDDANLQLSKLSPITGMFALLVFMMT